MITMFGCGGDRDRTKRPLMGQAAGAGSDVVVLTSDNPRGEDPLAIIEQVLPGLSQTAATVIVEPDRQRAIALAIDRGAAGRPGTSGRQRTRKDSDHRRAGDTVR